MSINSGMLGAGASCRRGTPCQCARRGRRGGVPVAGAESASATIDDLEAQGYDVQINWVSGVSSVPLSRCRVTAIDSPDHSPGSEGRPTTVAESTTGTRSPVTIRMRRRETHGNVAVAVQARANHGG